MSLDLSTYKTEKTEKKDFKFDTNQIQFSKKFTDKKKEVF